MGSIACGCACSALCVHSAVLGDIVLRCALYRHVCVCVVAIIVSVRCGAVLCCAVCFVGLLCVVAVCVLLQCVLCLCVSSLLHHCTLTVPHDCIPVP